MFAASAIVIALAAAVASAQDLSIQKPSLIQCGSSVINFTGGSGPYYVAIVKNEDACGDAIQEFFDVSDSSVSYTPALASGSQVLVYVQDANGAEAWSDTITIGSGDSSCLGSSHPPTPAQETPTQPTPVQNTPTYTPPTNDQTINSSYEGSPSAPSSSSISSQPISTTGTPYVAPNNAAPTSTVPIDTENSGVQNTNTNNKDTTPADASSRATGLTVSAFTALCAILVVSFGLF